MCNNAITEKENKFFCKIYWSELINKTSFTEREHGMREKCVDPLSNSDKKQYLYWKKTQTTTVGRCSHSSVPKKDCV